MIEASEARRRTDEAFQQLYGQYLKEIEGAIEKAVTDGQGELYFPGSSNTDVNDVVIEILSDYGYHVTIVQGEYNSRNLRIEW